MICTRVSELIAYLQKFEEDVELLTNIKLSVKTLEVYDENGEAGSKNYLCFTKTFKEPDDE